MKRAILFRNMAIAALALMACGFTACSDDDAPGVTPSLDVENGNGAAPEFETIKVINYNTLEGFKDSDKANNYDNLVAWMTAQNPDIVAFEEMWKWNDEQQLKDLAARWGHEHVAININANTNYHVALTSKHPIDEVHMFTDQLSHGALHAKIKGMNVVVLHTWPNWAAPTYEDNPGAYSPTAANGEAYRVEEVNRVLDQTIRLKPEEPLWIMCGDYNSVSPLDKEAYGKGTNYEVHNLILQSGYYDSWRELHNYFNPTQVESVVENPRRIDFIYVSKAVLSHMTAADILKDEYTSNPTIASDHYPCVMEFKMRTNN